MDISAHYRSVTQEMAALKDRVRNFIEGAHWLTDGEWKESVLRSCLARHLPETVRIGRGFVLTDSGPTTQCDVLLYRSDCPIVFRDGDLVFLTPDAVLAIIEVKSTLKAKTLKDVLEKFAAIGKLMGDTPEPVQFGLFAYDSDLQTATVESALHDLCDHDTKIIDLICSGPSMLVKWWKRKPDSSDKQYYQKWHIYDLPDAAPGYFISGVLHHVSRDSLSQNSHAWLPGESLEQSCSDVVDYKHGLEE